MKKKERERISSLKKLRSITCTPSFFILNSIFHPIERAYFFIVIAIFLSLRCATIVQRLQLLSQ